jgi:hypothetical protein
MPRGGARPGAGRPPGARNKLAALQRSKVYKRFPSVLMRAFEIIFAPRWEERVDLAVEEIKVGRERIKQLVKKKQIFEGPSDARRDMMLIAVLPYMHPRMGPDPDEETEDDRMGPYPLDISKLTIEERAQMQAAAAILAPLYRKAQLRTTNGNGNGNGDDVSGSPVASGPDQAVGAAPQMRGGKKLNEIPLVVAGPRYLSVDKIDPPPLFGVAKSALAIYRLDADYRHQLFHSGQETLFVISNDPTVVPSVVGSGVVIGLPVDGNAMYVGVALVSRTTPKIACIALRYARLHNRDGAGKTRQKKIRDAYDQSRFRMAPMGAAYSCAGNHLEQSVRWRRPLGCLSHDPRRANAEDRGNRRHRLLRHRGLRGISQAQGRWAPPRCETDLPEY